ncbi:MAG TPA: nuclear transport factor 2 family protein [Chloroflexota bacterium]|nr:nuclear transport factor 2 family protein [Chloroflexota bacterium]
MSTDQPYIELLGAYQAACNRHDIEACVAMFTEAGEIVSGGESYVGTAVIRAAHEYDLASHTLVEFRDFEIEGNVVRCTFWNEHELSRAIGTGGMTGKAEFTFADGRIQKFHILPPDDTERQRVMAKVGPTFKWLRENHPEAVARWQGFDRAAGEAVTALADLWRAHQQEGA